MSPDTTARSIDGWLSALSALFTHPRDAQWNEVVPVEHIEEAPEEPPRRRRWK